MSNHEQSELTPPPGSILAVSVGNTRAQLAVVTGLDVGPARSASVDDSSALAHAAAELIEQASGDAPDAALLGSVNHPAADAITAALGERLGLPVERFGPSLPVPIATEVAEPARVGQDRLLAALGAFATVNQACIVVDAGTALTVDFVDGSGVFHGGAIIPGGRLMLRALHEHTSALPDLNLADMPDPLEPFGKSTEHAMFLGVRAAIRGSVRYLAERYADYYDAYPQIVATGGDADLLLSGDELIENMVPDLVLRGIAAARARYAAGQDIDE